MVLATAIPEVGRRFLHTTGVYPCLRASVQTTPILQLVSNPPGPGSAAIVGCGIGFPFIGMSGPGPTAVVGSDSGTTLVADSGSGPTAVAWLGSGHIGGRVWVWVEPYSSSGRDRVGHPGGGRVGV